MSVISNDAIWASLACAALQNVYDPEIGLNVVDLGLIYQLDFNHEELKLWCSMTLTTQFCPMGESIRDGVKQALEKTFPEYTIEMNLIFDPPWSYERISAEGKEFLNQ